VPYLATFFLINEAQLHSFITRAFNSSQNKSTVLLLKVYSTASKTHGAAQT